MADTVWDLHKAIEGPRLERADSEPCMGTSAPTASDIAHPGGFRRQHLRQHAKLGPSRSVKNLVEANIAQIYIPFINGMLSQDDDEYAGHELRERIQWILEDKQQEQPLRVIPDESSFLIRRKRKSTTLGQALLALLKAFVGTGVLFLPNGFKNGGMFFSPVILIIVAYLTIYAMIRLLDCQKLVGGTYGYIGEKAYGPMGRRMVQLSIVLMQFGFCCTYIIFVASNMSDVLAYWGLTVSISHLILLQAVVYIPLSWVRHINFFAFSNLIADAFILYGLAFILGNATTQLAQEGVAPEIIAFNPADYSIFIGTAVFTFEGIGLVIPTQSSLNDERKAKFQPLLVKTIVGLLTFYCFFSVINYAAYGPAITPIVTSSLPSNGWTVSVQFGYSIAQLLSYPLFLFPAISIIEETFFFVKRQSGKKLQKNSVRSVTVLFTILIAYYGQARLDLFVSIVGAVCCVPLSFIYPPLFYLKLHPRASLRDQLMDISVIVIGVLTFLFVTGTNVNKWISGST